MELYTLQTANMLGQSVIMVRFRFTFCKLSNPGKVVYELDIVWTVYHLANLVCSVLRTTRYVQLLCGCRKKFATYSLKTLLRMDQ